ncbi:MAG: rRNA pseudouridine synthase [Planctomycetia bacterium]|nr:rRNA pseudouridine synthase [Planctomycetia bacterium]
MSRFARKRRFPQRRDDDRPASARPSAAPRDTTRADDPARLQKVMARAGIGSRRHCETLIAEGRVEVDGRIVTELGTKVRADQQVRVDGAPLARTRLVYYLVNKPSGVVSTNFDPSGRPRVIDLLPPTHERLFTVGRLDMSSEGLILLTNDGELANHLAHPRYGVEKTYQVLVAGAPDRDMLTTLRDGVHLAEGLARVASVHVKKSLPKSTLLEIVLREGKNREIRRILAKVGHKVLRLKRTAIDGLRLGEIAPGEYRRLTGDEVRALRGHGRGASTKRPPGRRPRTNPRPVRDTAGSLPGRDKARGRRQAVADKVVAAPSVTKRAPRGRREQAWKGKRR